MNIPRHIKPKPIHVLVAVRANSGRIIVITFRTAWRAPTRLLFDKREELASRDLRSFSRPQNPSAASVSRVRRTMVPMPCVRGRNKMNTAANTVGISVPPANSGPGLDPKQLGSIFDAFFTTKSHGIGLGLAICRMIVERHGGQLTAASDRNNGARFQFVLPTEFADVAHTN
jgi:Histidine kinase-, DNA gyrase B-, and HSP90-like ATPase